MADFDSSKMFSSGGKRKNTTGANFFMEVPELGDVRAALLTLTNAMESSNGILGNHTDVLEQLSGRGDVDLAPLRDDLTDLKGYIDKLVKAVSSIEIQAPESPKKAPEKWTFDVKRNQSGFIKSVEATSE